MLLMKKPPHMYVSTSCPTTGTTVIRLVITVSAQYDISPHGSTYPKNATPIMSSHNIRPQTHTVGII